MTKSPEGGEDPGMIGRQSVLEFVFSSSDPKFNPAADPHLRFCCLVSCIHCLFQYLCCFVYFCCLSLLINDYKIEKFLISLSLLSSSHSSVSFSLQFLSLFNISSPALDVNEADERSKEKISNYFGL